MEVDHQHYRFGTRVTLGPLMCHDRPIRYEMADGPFTIVINAALEPCFSDGGPDIPAKYPARPRSTFLIQRRGRVREPMTPLAQVAPAWRHPASRARVPIFAAGPPVLAHIPSDGGRGRAPAKSGSLFKDLTSSSRNREFRCHAGENRTAVFCLKT